MMPTIAASTGAPFLPSASPAARPSSTTSTFSLTPAPTPSTASSAWPRGVSSMFNGCTSISLAPSNLRCFCVETTVPTTLQICTLQLQDCRIAELQEGKGEGEQAYSFDPCWPSLSAILQFCNPSLLPEVPVIDDANDAGIDRRFGRIKREA